MDRDETERLGAGSDTRRGGRPSAGCDPRKRRQILDGATEVFRRMGFDAASMADVAREAGVSKATLYVYYTNKEELFAAVVGEERDRSVGQVLETLDPDRPASEVLEALGREMIALLTRPKVVQAHRIVIGVVERMPEIGRQMYVAGARRVADAVAAYLRSRVAAGELAIPDPELAAIQFIELCQAGVIRPRLFAVIEGVAGEAEIDRTVIGALEMFMARYAIEERAR